MQLAGDAPAERDEPGSSLPTDSATVAAHAHLLVQDLMARHLIGPRSRTLEVASHGGHLQPFLRAAGLASTLAEPDEGHAGRAARQGGIVLRTTLGRLADETGQAGRWDLILDHYRLAHELRPTGMLDAIARLLAPEGVAVLEFDHLLPTLQGRQVDAIRHGHWSYVSLTWLAAAAREHGLVVTDLQQLALYGGSLRVFVQRADQRRSSRGIIQGTPTPVVMRVLHEEEEAGLASDAPYLAFAVGARRGRAMAVRYLRRRARAGKRILGYGAPARATTLLNWYRIGPDLLPFVADASVAKQGRLIPGMAVPIRSPADLVSARPDDVLILVWDIAAEVISQLMERGIDPAKTRFLVPVPELRRVTV